jgi:hypothetical protein
MGPTGAIGASVAQRDDRRAAGGDVVQVGHHRRGRRPLRLVTTSVLDVGTRGVLEQGDDALRQDVHRDGERGDELEARGDPVMHQGHRGRADGVQMGLDVGDRGGRLERLERPRRERDGENDGHGDGQHDKGQTGTPHE